MVKGKYLNFIASTLRKSQWQIVAISILFIIASALINIFLFLSTDYQQNFFREAKRLSGEDVDLLLMNLTPGTDCEKTLNGALQNCEEIKQYEIDPVVTALGTVEYKDAVLSNYISFIRLDQAKEKQIGRYEILESDSSDGVYLSYLFKIDGGYQIGQTVSLKLGAKDYVFPIAGFYHNVDTGTANCTDIAILLPEKEFRSAESVHGSSYRVSVILQNPENPEVQGSQIAKRIEAECPSLILADIHSKQKLSISRYVSATLLKAMISVAAVLMSIVILAAIAITLSNYIRNHIRNLGLLKALGYSSGDLIFPIVGEFSIIALVMSGIGILSSYAILPALNDALEKQVGIPYEIHFLFPQAAITSFICVILSAFSAYFSVLKIKRIYPMNAIRDSSEKKKRIPGFFSLEKTRLGIHTAISFKTIGSKKSHGIVLLLSMVLIGFLLGFSAFTYQNVILNQDPILDLVCGQRTDSVLTVSNESKDLLLSELKNNASVERYYLYSSFPITPEEKPKIYAYIVDETYVPQEKVYLKGRMPKSEDEIAVNQKYADENRIRLGDLISFESENGTVEFTVIGFIQGAFNAGNDGYLTVSGYSRIAAMPYSGYYVDLKEGSDIDEFNRNLSEKCPLLSCTNYEKSIQAVSASYIEILILATGVIILVSFIIAAFVLYILLSVLLANQYREHGILKAIGFLSKEIMYQTVFSQLPPCLIGVVVGLAISRQGAGKLLSSALGSVGIFSFGVSTKLTYLFAVGFSLLLFTIAISAWMSASVRKITPHQLFNKE